MQKKLHSSDFAASCAKIFSASDSDSDKTLVVGKRPSIYSHTHSYCNLPRMLGAVTFLSYRSHAYT